MQLFRFDVDVAWPITDYESLFRLARLLWAHEGEVRVDCIFLGPGDHVGAHPAGLPQLFCVVSGDGWVQGEDRAKVAIAAGQAAFWASGEAHAATTEASMTAIVIQAEALDPAAMLTLI